MKRTVAFLDVLGFRKLVAETPCEELGPKFARVMKTVVQHLNQPVLLNQDHPRLLTAIQPGRPYCLSFAFSDSIILISHDDSRSSGLAVLVYALRAMQALLAAKYGVRAAVTFDEMFVDIKHSLFLGPALTRAYDLEQSQDWIGGLVDERVAAVLPDLFNDLSKGTLLDVLFPTYVVPLKSGDVRPFRTFNWRWNMVVQEGTRSMFRDTALWQDRRKVINTLDYARWIRTEGLAYPADADAVPIEVRTFFVGKGPPPPQFTHGDDL